MSAAPIMTRPPLSPELKALLARIAADPNSTKAAPQVRKPDAMVTPGLEVARAYMGPKPAGPELHEDLIDRIPGGWLTVGGLVLLGIVAVMRGRD